MAKKLEDHERAHTGKPGMKVRHGTDAIGKIPTRTPTTEERPQDPVYQRLRGLYKGLD